MQPESWGSSSWGWKREEMLFCSDLNLIFAFLKGCGKASDAKCVRVWAESMAQAQCFVFNSWIQMSYKALI